jgi:hypothetical protein
MLNPDFAIRGNINVQEATVVPSAVFPGVVEQKIMPTGIVRHFYGSIYWLSRINFCQSFY